MCNPNYMKYLIVIDYYRPTPRVVNKQTEFQLQFLMIIVSLKEEWANLMRLRESGRIQQSKQEEIQDKLFTTSPQLLLLM